MAIDILRRKQAFFAPKITQLNETLVEARKMARAEEAARERECRSAVHALHAIVLERMVRRCVLSVLLYPTTHTRTHAGEAAAGCGAAGADTRGGTAREIAAEGVRAPVWAVAARIGGRTGSDGGCSSSSARCRAACVS